MTNPHSKAKLSRRLGVALTPKAAAVMAKRPNPPGQHGAKRRSARSDFGKQLLEKQRLKFQYNVDERQLKNIFALAKKAKGNTGEELVRLLESRLDTVVLRAGFAPTIYAARQCVSHGHIQLNGRRVNTPSQRVKPNDVISVKEKSRKVPLIQDAMANASIPGYIERDRENFSAKYIRPPALEEAQIICDVPLVVEFYSR